MEEFVAMVRDSIDKGKRNFNSNEKSLMVRDFLKVAMNSVPEIDIKPISPEGDVCFGLELKDIEVSQSIFIKYRSVIFSDFMANFLGEFFVRENLNRFAKILTDIDCNDYNSIVNNYEHKCFGMEINSGRLYFHFHVSLLQNILTEDLKKL